MNKKERNKIKRQLLNISNNSRARMPMWTVMDIFTCDLLLETVNLIEELEKEIKRKK